jgi:site-specific DNA-methyltransferase (adenine-specific)
VTDTIFYYSKGADPTWHKPFVPLTEENIASKYTLKEPDGRRYTTRDLRNPGVRPNLHYEYKGYKPHPNGWSISREKMEEYDRQDRLYFPKEKDGRIRLKLYLDESQGKAIQNLWDDIPPINSQAQERLGYPTQKPIALLERIIEVSSNKGDIVLDPFCGCGTSIHAAQKLNRKWIGIDITHLAISLIQKRLRDAFGPIPITIHGVPRDLDGARALAAQDKYQFQWWAVSLVDAVPYGGKKKGADSGIDGFIYFKPDGKTTEKAIVSVKGGESVGVPMARELAQVVNREKAKLGVLICLAEPTAPMKKEAIAEGFYKTDYGEFPKIQILTIAQLFAGQRPDMPWIDPTVFRKAKAEKGRQEKLL